MYTTLIQPAQLAVLSADENVVILDCRHDLARPQWSDQAYGLPLPQYTSIAIILPGQCELSLNSRA